MMENSSNFKIFRHYTLGQINAYAMQHGVMMGIWGIATLASMVWGLQNGFLAMLSIVLLFGTPFFAYALTKRYRVDSAEGKTIFTLTQGFLHAFLTFFYGALWVAVFTYVYMAYVDNGFLVDSYLQYLSRPDVVEAMQQSGWKEQVEPMLGGKSIEEVVESFRLLPPTYYVLMSINTCLLWAPMLSLVIGIVARRKK